jgi:inosine-uridine nucleoside N-ribohydrolase
MTTQLLLDVDTGTDDAVALMAAALHPDLELVGVTTVNGNVPVEVATENTLRVLDHIDARVPVYEGAVRPMVRRDFPVPRAAWSAERSMHGEYLDLPPARSTKEPESAVRFLAEYYLGPAGPLTVLVPTGPLTNIALAMSTSPEIVPRIPRIVLMGGGHEVSNVSPSAEFNIWADPEAARVVLASGVKDLTIVPLDCTHQTVVSLQDCEELAALGTLAGRAASSLIHRRIAAHDGDQPLDPEHTAAVHDAVCVACLVRPDVLRRAARYHVDVETAGELCIGRTVIDTHRRSGKEPNATVALGGDAEVFVGFLKSTFGPA